MRIKEKLTTKHRLSSVLRDWLPILQANLNELDEVVKSHRDENPFIEICSGFERKEKNSYNTDKYEYAEDNNLKYASIYEKLFEQIQPPLFPTPISQTIAYKIIEDLNQDGFFDGDIEEIAKILNINSKMVEQVRVRFSYLEPVGIGAINLKESFLFQLKSFDGLEPIVYKSAVLLINNLENIYKYKNKPFFNESLKIIRLFKNPPAIDFIEDSNQVTPDLFILLEDNAFNIYINESFYPLIKINSNFENLNNIYVKKKLKDAKLLIDSLQMRKSTIYKIGLMILEYQYDFFNGGSIKPLKLQILADEFGHNVSTISRAISNKYLFCNRGFFSMKTFFSTEIEDGISSSFIKNEIKNIIKEENFQKPYTDIEILNILNSNLKDKISDSSLKLVRRTITKYRQQLNIESSNKRKKIYLLRI